VAGLDFSNPPPVDRCGIAVLFVARDNAALAGDALPHVEVEAVLLSGVRRARRDQAGAITYVEVGVTFASPVE
jgi:hypothetical protein